jgi:hypothetical protein
MTQFSRQSTQFSRQSIVASVISASKMPDERLPGSSTLATLPPNFFLLHEGAYRGFGKYKCLRERVPALTYRFEIELFDEVYTLTLVSPGPVYRANCEWESFFGVCSKKQFETNKVGDQVLVWFPNKPKRFDINAMILARWNQMYGKELMRECDFEPLFEEATKDLKNLLGSILFKGKDLADVATPEEVREFLTWCLVSGYLSLNQYKRLFEHFVKHRLVSADEPITGYLCKHMHQTLTPAQSAIVNDMRDVVLDLVNSVLDPVLPIPVVLPVPLVLHSRNKFSCMLM